MVGESLARFGSCDFREAASNSSRAITARDYALLLRNFLHEFGACFADEFVGARACLLMGACLVRLPAGAPAL